MSRLRALHPDAIFISARTGRGVADLVGAVEDRLRAGTTLLHLAVPYERADVIAAAHRLGEVVAEKHEDDAAAIDVRLYSKDLAQFAEFAV